MRKVKFYNYRNNEWNDVELEEVLRWVGKGWHRLVTSLISDLFDMGWDGKLAQIKEKFGGLRFYNNSGSKEIDERIAQAEKESYKTCEQCGAEGEIRGDLRWIKSLCDEHYKETIDRYKETIDKRPQV